MQKFMFKFVVAICLAVSLGACAQAARPGALVAPLAQNNILPAGDPISWINKSRISDGWTRDKPSLDVRNLKRGL